MQILRFTKLNSSYASLSAKCTDLQTKRFIVQHCVYEFAFQFIIIDIGTQIRMVIQFQMTATVPYVTRIILMKLNVVT